LKKGIRDLKNRQRSTAKKEHMQKTKYVII